MRRLGYMGRTVHCGFRVGSIGPHYGKQTTLALPSDDGETFYESCLVVLEKIPVKPEQVSNVGVSVGNLVETDRTLQSLLEVDRRRERLNQAELASALGVSDRTGGCLSRTSCPLL